MYLIYAPNVRSGGGLVLLQALLSNWSGPETLRAVLDSRARLNLTISGNVTPDWVKPGLTGRMLAELNLARQMKTFECIVCFHGLPPLAMKCRPDVRTVVFLQNILLVDGSSLRDYALRTRMRITLERLLFQWRMPHVSDIVVQGQTMARAVSEQLRGRVLAPCILICPFASPSAPRTIDAGERKFDFIYPASGEPHKNHATLLSSWERLRLDGFAPSLALTLGEQDLALWQQLQERARRAGLNVINLGYLSRQRMLEAYSQSTALVFPSLKESFGLPLVEAAAIGLPIVAGELDFIRDVCEPAQTFNPVSAISIARAIKRQLGQQEHRARISTPAEFWEALTGSSQAP